MYENRVCLIVCVTRSHRSHVRRQSFAELKSLSSAFFLKKNVTCVKHAFSHRKHDQALRSSNSLSSAIMVLTCLKYVFSHRKHDQALRSSKSFLSTYLKPSPVISPASPRYAHLYINEYNFVRYAGETNFHAPM